MSLTGIRGNRAENLAAKFLANNKLKIVQRNFRSRFGEIDLIAEDTASLVFVEVRYRKSQDFGGALASVDFRKQAKLRKTAEYFLLRYKNAVPACRFDIICLTGDLSDAQVQWVKNAF